MGLHESGMAMPSVDLVSGTASNIAASAVSRADEACPTRPAPTCLTSDNGKCVTQARHDRVGFMLMPIHGRYPYT